MPSQMKHMYEITKPKQYSCDKALMGETTTWVQNTMDVNI